jgi:hypothetical protein
LIAPSQDWTREQRLWSQIERGTRATCPCCAYPTIGGRGANEICVLCSWEDDGQDDPYYAPPNAPAPNVVVGGANADYSLAEARENFAQYFTHYRPTDRDFERERAATKVKREVTHVYERVIDADISLEEADDLVRILFAREDSETF